ncbi:hypothetical protein LBMAG53_37620 [Planctomycetota bacterium]|nr:hypothetical protein LBMAG53_37620 [Planctomycetota bacterium]
MRPLIPIFAILTVLAADPSSDQVRQAWPSAAGLVVQIGASDGAFLADLARGGRRLVHGLAADEEVTARLRQALHQAGVHPAASVATWAGPGLPYADRLVNVLIIDRDACPATPDDELRRVVAPGGTILARSKGSWAVITIPRPDTLGDWNHFDGGADGNAVGADREVGPIHALQWMDNGRDLRWMKTGPEGGNQGNLRVSGRYCLIDATVDGGKVDAKTRLPPRVELDCRDAANGLPLWSVPREPGVAGRRWSLAVAGGKVFTWLKAGADAAILDLATGAVIGSLPGTAPSTAKGNLDGESVVVRATADGVWVGHGATASCFGPDGTLRWRFERPGRELDFTVVDGATKRVYLVVSVPGRDDRGNPSHAYWGRWPASTAVESVTALDAASGRLLWESTDAASVEIGVNAKTKKPILRTIGQLLPVGDRLVCFSGVAIASSGSGSITVLDAATGKLVHDLGQAVKPNYNISMYSAVVRDGAVWFNGAFNNIWRLDPVAGKIEQVFSHSWNHRCTRMVATPDWLIASQTSFLDKTLAGPQVSVARSGCALSGVPAAGQMFFGPHVCACTSHLDGFLAFSPRPAPAPVDDTSRLVRLAGRALALPATASATASATTPLTRLWSGFTVAQDVTDAQQTIAGWTFTVRPNLHRLEATGPAGSWSFTAGARLGHSLAVVGGLVVIGAHDGRVHGLDLATGAERWRRLVAPAESLIVLNGQLASRWPVFGVADLGDGLVVASAGTHAELDGGIRVEAIRAATGEAVWARTLHKDPSVYGPGGKGGTPIISRTLINAAPTVIDGHITIAGGHHLGTFSFAPTESQADLDKRFAIPPSKGK